MDAELEKLLTPDVTAEQLEACKQALEELDEDSKIDFATELVLQFPSEELSDFYDRIERLRPQNESKEEEAEEEYCHIHQALSQAMEARSWLEAIFNEANERPYEMILSDKFNIDLFNQFHKLCIQMTDGIEDDCANFLAERTPPEYRNAVALRLNHAFEERSKLAIAIGAALTICAIQRTSLASSGGMYSGRSPSIEQKNDKASEDKEMVINSSLCP